MNGDNYEIDVSEIWKRERDSYLEHISTLSDLKKLHSFLLDFFYTSGHPPFLKYDDVEKTKTKKLYYDRLLKEALTFDEVNIPTIYVKQSDLYVMDIPVIIRKNSEIPERNFQKLFALKLRLYENNLIETASFLNFQLKMNFRNNKKNIDNFLDILILQYPGFFSDNLKVVLHRWINQKKDKVIKKKKPEQIDLPPPVDSTVIDEVRETKPSNENLAPDFEIIEGAFTIEETLSFFSFFYKEPVKKVQTLTKIEVDEIFAGGIVIPFNEKEKKFTLNPKGLSKGFVEYAINYFFKNHKTDNKLPKKKILLFFAHHFTDFEKALRSDLEMENWYKTVSGRKPKRMPFILENYLPERLIERKPTPGRFKKI